MTGGTNYKKQYEKNIEKAVNRGDITITEYHQQVANLKGRDLHGIDDGHSCTRGNKIPKIHPSVYFSV